MMRGCGALAVLSLLACGEGAAPDTPATGPAAQEACLEGVETESEPLSDDVCACIVASDDRPFTPGIDQSGVEDNAADAADRAADPALAHWNDRIRSTRCGCCHNAAYEGPGSFYWDLAYQPVWVDSVTDERLRLMAGLAEKPGGGQQLTFDESELAELAAFVETELERRAQARLR